MKKQSDTKPKPSNDNSNDFLSKVDQFFQKRSKIWLTTSVICTILFGFLIFDMKVSVGGDDSAYILRAYRFIKDGAFPSFQAPLYPIVMSVFVGIFGIKLFLLKMLSLAFLVVNLIYFYKAFKDSAPSSIFYPVLLLTSINHFLLYYGSQTYSEAMFIAVQSITFFVVFKSFFNNPINDSEINVKDHWKLFLISGLWMCVMFLTRKIGGGFFLALMFFFLIHLKWRHMIGTAAGFASWVGAYIVMKTIIWGDQLKVAGAQENRIMLKDPYNADKGYEDLSGFIDRFIGNSQLYLSKHMMIFASLRKDVPIAYKTLQESGSAMLAVILYALFGVAVIFTFRKNKQILLSLIYLAIMLGLTFVLLATKWDQGRLVIVYTPLVLLGLFSGLYYVWKIPFFKKLQIPLFIAIMLLFIPTFNGVTEKTKGKLIDMRYNLRGDVYHGYTPDWINYLKMCEWAAENIPEDVMVGARKPSMAFIYSGGRRFHGIYRLPSQDPDTLLNLLKENNVRYVIMANLRKIPQKKTQYTINTVQRYLGIMQKKYPQLIRVKHKIGNDEPAFLFEIAY